MPVMAGDAAPIDVRAGDDQVLRICVGDELVWSSAPLLRPTFTVDGTAFAPRLELVGGSSATVQWTDETDTVVATGLSPSISWGDAGPHTVRLVCTAPSDVTTLNLGFHDLQDEGVYRLSSAYNYATQPVTAIENLSALPGLVRFMAARTNGSSSDHTLYTGPVLAGPLDFTGLSDLQYIEVFQAAVTATNLAGCTSLIRLCIEGCNVANLDLNPVAGSLRDLRAAIQTGGSLTLAALTSPMSVLYHFCTRRQTLVGLPDMADLPAIRQLWIWRCNLNEDELVIRTNAVGLHSALLSSSSGGGTENVIRSLDLAGVTWAALSGAQRLHAFGVGLQDIDLTGMGAVEELLLYSNELSEADVDHVLAVADAWGTSGGTLRLDGNSPPSPAGVAAAENLQGRGWTVQHDTPVSVLWSDEFNRADASGWANSGGWFPASTESDTDVAISSNRLVLTGASSYRRFLHAAGGALPANVEVEVGFTISSASEPGANWGIVNRWNVANDTGCRVLFRSTKVLLRIGSAANATDASPDVDISGLVPGWNDLGQHTVRLRSVGSAHQVYCDDVLVASRSFGTNSSFANGAVGFCGQPLGRAWDYIRVYAI